MIGCPFVFNQSGVAQNKYNVLSVGRLLAVAPPVPNHGIAAVVGDAVSPGSNNSTNKIINLREVRAKAVVDFMGVPTPDFGFTLMGGYRQILPLVSGILGTTLLLGQQAVIGSSNPDVGCGDGCRFEGWHHFTVCPAPCDNRDTAKAGQYALMGGSCLLMTLYTTN